MATIRVYIQPRFPAAANQLAFYDFSKHVDFTTLEWENNDQGTQSIMRATLGSIMPTSTTSWMAYPGATEAEKIQNALNDDFFHLKIYPRTEVQIRDVSTSPHTILWGGIVTRTEEIKEGGAISGSLEALDYTELLNESVALEYTSAAQSTIKQVITSQTYSFTVTNAARTDNIVTLTVSGTPTLGSPYSRELGIGDPIIVYLDDATYNGIHTVTAVTQVGANTEVKYVQYSSVGDSASAAVTGTAKIYGFLTTDNAPGIDSRIRVQAENIYDLNTAYKFSPKSQGTIRTVQNVARADVSNPYRATITTSAVHPFAVGQRVTLALTSGPTNYATLNGTWTVYSTPTSGTFTVDTDSNLTITSGAAAGSATGDGVVSPTPIKGGTLRQNLETVVSKGTGVFYLNSGTIDGSGDLDIDLYVRAKDQVDLVANGLFEGGSSTGWTLGSWLVDSVGNTGPFGVGNTIYYTGSDHQDAEMHPDYRITVVAGEKYFVTWRHYSEKDAKEKPRMKFYDAGGAVVGNSHGTPINQHNPVDDEWHKDFGVVVVPANAVKMSFTLHHEAHSSSYTARFTDIQIIKLTGAFGFSDHPLEDTVTYSYDLRDFENPSAPSESGEAANRIYIYAPYTTEDELTGAKQITNYRNTYDFVQGVWESGGKRIEASKVSTDATTSELARLTAQKFFKDRGQTLRSYEFEHISGPLSVGDVVPFIWDELGIAEALVVRKQTGYMIGDSPFYRVQLGGDMAFQRNTMYLVEQKLAEITGKSTTITPIASPYPGTPTAGGVVTPAVPVLNAGTGFIGVSWRYPSATLKSDSFGGFVILRSADAGASWYKVSTQTEIQASPDPLAPDSMITEYGDSQVSNTEQYTYKIAAIDVSGSEPVITEYSTVSAQAQPNAFPGGQDLTTPYTGLGVNVPKVVYSLVEGETGFVVESGDPTSNLPDAQYPPGQYVYSDTQGKLFRVSAANLWQRAAIDKIDVSSTGEVTITADNITAGNLNAGVVNITDLNVQSINSGDIELVDDNDTGLSEIRFKNASGNYVSTWNRDGLEIKAQNSTNKRVLISEGTINLINDDGDLTAALDGNGINATSITIGQLPGGSNSIPNSSFELAAFGTPTLEPVYGNKLRSYLTVSAGSAVVSSTNLAPVVSGTITNVQNGTPTAGKIRYTCSNTFAVNDYVTIVGVVNTGGTGTTVFNMSNQLVTAVTSTYFEITVTLTLSPVYASSTGRAYRDTLEQTTYTY
jgi:hypothetical protein